MNYNNKIYKKQKVLTTKFRKRKINNKFSVNTNR